MQNRKAFGYVFIQYECPQLIAVYTILRYCTVFPLAAAPFKMESKNQCKCLSL